MCRFESVATVQPDRTILCEIDGVGVPEELARRRVDFQLSPGRHMIGIAVHDYQRGFLARRLVYSTGVKICLEAEAGRTYLARSLVEGQRWKPEMLDGVTMKPVPTAPPSPKTKIRARYAGNPPSTAGSRT